MIGFIVLIWQLSASLTQPICAAGLNEFGAYSSVVGHPDLWEKK